jgi:hypothetical protein
LPGQPVELQIGQLDHIVLGRGASAQQRPHPHQQFRQREWLYQIVVGACFEIIRLGVQIAARGENQHRNSQSQIPHAL